MVNTLCRQPLFSRQSERFNDRGDIFPEVEETLCRELPAE